MIRKTKAQIWVSAVIYTLIGLTAIGILLSIVQPRIQEMRDGITIKQTIEALHDFDSSLRSTLIAPGNKRNIEFKLSAGKLEIKPESDLIVWSMQSANKFSQPGSPIKEGTIEILTEKKNPWLVSLSLNYTGIANITFDSLKTKTLARAEKPYQIIIENLGSQKGELQQINIKLG